MSPNQTGATPDATGQSDGELSLTVVRYDDGADRCTVYPPNATGDSRLSTWLSVDYEAVVDLAAMQ
jgi:hypothetical protein